MKWKINAKKKKNKEAIFLIIVVKRASEILKKPAKDESYFW
jgi:hypothetical protein